MINARKIDDMTVHKAHCDWMAKNALDLKALFSYKSKEMVEANKNRALADINVIINSLSELRLYIESL